MIRCALSVVLLVVGFCVAVSDGDASFDETQTPSPQTKGKKQKQKDAELEQLKKQQQLLEQEKKKNAIANKAITNKGKNKETTKDKLKLDNELVHELQAAHRVLAAADPIYNGHRAHAMKEINHAIGNLEKEMHARGLKEHSKHHQNLPRQISHAMIATTAEALVTINSHLSAMEKTTHRTKSSEHVTRAFGELKKALDFVGYDHGKTKN